MRLLDASRRLSRPEIDHDYRMMGWFGLGLAAVGLLSLLVATLFFDS